MQTGFSFAVVIIIAMVGLSKQETRVLNVGNRCPSSSTYTVNEDESFELVLNDDSSHCDVEFTGADDISSSNEYKICVTAEKWELTGHNDNVYYKQHYIWFMTDETHSLGGQPDKWCGNSDNNIRIEFDIDSRAEIRLKVTCVNTYNLPWVAFLITLGSGAGGFCIIVILICVFRRRQLTVQSSSANSNTVVVN